MACRDVHLFHFTLLPTTSPFNTFSFLFLLRGVYPGLESMRCCGYEHPESAVVVAIGGKELGPEVRWEEEG